MGEIIALIQGDNHRTEIGLPSVAITLGSVQLVSLVPAFIAASLHQDLNTLREAGDLDSISPKRAEVIESWQSRAAKEGSKRRYNLVAALADHTSAYLEITSDTQYRHLQQDLWVRAEKYLTGRVVDMGGKTKPNLHLVLSSGESLKIEATESLLEGKDYLYRTMTVHILAQEHIHTGEIRNARLIDVVKPVRQIDEEKLKNLWHRGREAWAGIASPTEWVEQLRES